LLLRAWYERQQSYSIARLVEAASSAEVQSLKAGYVVSLYIEGLSKSFSEFLKPLRYKCPGKRFKICGDMIWVSRITSAAFPSGIDTISKKD
jgi:hypothetical protein